MIRLVVRTLLGVVLFGATAGALDKQGSAHGGKVEADEPAAEAENGFKVSGNVAVGVAPWNPTYGARPDNSGHALMRYAGHADIDLIGKTLSLPLDLNVFSDGDRRGIRKLAASEVDVIGGVGSTTAVGPGALELGLRGEYDMPVDGGTYAYGYVDVRAKYLYSLVALKPGVKDALKGGDVTGWLAAGWFAWNPSYPARPDNSGNALFRYGVHAEVSAFEKQVAAGVDVTMFTDRTNGHPLRIAEVDFTPEIIYRHAPFDVHFALERDMPVDQDGLVLMFAYVLVSWNWELGAKAAEELPVR